MDIMNRDPGIGKELRNWCNRVDDMASARTMPRKCARANFFATNHLLSIGKVLGLTSTTLDLLHSSSIVVPQ